MKRTDPEMADGLPRGRTAGRVLVGAVLLGTVPMILGGGGGAVAGELTFGQARDGKPGSIFAFREPSIRVETIMQAAEPDAPSKGEVQPAPRAVPRPSVASVDLEPPVEPVRSGRRGADGPSAAGGGGRDGGRGSAPRFVAGGAVMTVSAAGPELALEVKPAADVITVRSGIDAPSVGQDERAGAGAVPVRAALKNAEQDLVMAVELMAGVGLVGALGLGGSVLWLMRRRRSGSMTGVGGRPVVGQGREERIDEGRGERMEASRADRRGRSPGVTEGAAQGKARGGTPDRRADQRPEGRRADAQQAPPSERGSGSGEVRGKGSDFRGAAASGAGSSGPGQDRVPVASPGTAIGPSSEAGWGSAAVNDGGASGHWANADHRAMVGRLARRD